MNKIYRLLVLGVALLTCVQGWAVDPITVYFTSNIPCTVNNGEETIVLTENDYSPDYEWYEKTIELYAKLVVTQNGYSNSWYTVSDIGGVELADGPFDSGKTISRAAITNEAKTCFWEYPFVHAKLLIETYQITINKGDATIEGSTAKEYKIDANIDQNIGFIAPSRAGYHISEWTVNPDPMGGTPSVNSDNNKIIIPAGTYGDFALTPTFEGDESTIMVAANGGSGGTNITYRTSTQKQKFSFILPTKEGCAISDWGISPTPTEGEVTIQGNVITIAANASGDYTFTPTWEKAKYKITIDKNGGGGGDASKTYEINESEQTISFVPPSKENWRITNWVVTVDSAFKGELPTVSKENLTITIPAEAHGNFTIKPLYEQYQFTITINKGDGGSGGDSIVKYEISNFVQEKSFIPPSKTGYRIKKWETPDGVTVSGDNAKIIIPANYSGDIAITPVWEIVVWKITINQGGGSGGDTGKTYTISNWEQRIAFNAPSKTGYTLTGWDLDSAPTGTPPYVSADNKEIIIPANTYGDFTLTAAFAANKYKVVFFGNGGTNEMAMQEFTYDVTNNLNKCGYWHKIRSFAGWSRDPTNSVQYGDEGKVCNLATNANDIVRLYAIWELTEFSAALGCDNLKIEKLDSNSDWSVDDEGCYAYAHRNFSKGLRAQIDGDGELKFVFSLTAEEYEESETTEFLFDFAESNVTNLHKSCSLIPFATNVVVSGEKAKYAEWKIHGRCDTCATDYVYLHSMRWYPLVTNEYVGVTFRVPQLGEAEGYVYTNVTRKVGEVYGELPVVYSNGVKNVGWETTNGVRIAANSIVPHVDGDYRVQLLATWETIDKDYVITINAGDGGSAGTESVEYHYNAEEDQTCTIDELPSKGGYSISDWTVDPLPRGAAAPAVVGNEITILANTYGDFAITPTYTANVYKVTINKNGGTGGDDYKAYSISGVAQEVTLNAPSRSGYDFSGWTVTSGPENGSASVSDNVLTINANTYGAITIKANWKKCSYTITIDANGGSGGDTTKTYGISTGKQSKGFNLPSKVGYNLVGWTVSKPISGDPYVEGGTIYIPAGTYGDFSITAEYEAKNYTITIYANGGSGGDAEKSYQIGGTNITFTIPSMPGYSLSGWDITEYPDGGDDPSAEGNTITIPANTYGDFAIEASWAYAQHTITINKGDGDCISWTKSLLYQRNEQWSQSKTIEVLPTKAGYSIAGWTVDPKPTGEVPTIAGNKISIPANTYGDFEITPAYTGNVYTITINKGDGGSGGDDLKLYAVTNVAQSVTFVAPSKTGYRVSGWTVEAPLPTGGTVEIAGETITIPANVYGDFAITPTYAANDYTVEFFGNGGTGTMVAQTFAYGTEQTLEANKFAREKAAFAGWSKDPTNAVDFLDGAAVADLTAEANGVVRLYAIWTNAVAEVSEYSKALGCDNLSITGDGWVIDTVGGGCKATAENDEGGGTLSATISGAGVLEFDYYVVNEFKSSITEGYNSNLKFFKGDSMGSGFPVYYTCKLTRYVENIAATCEVKWEMEAGYMMTGGKTDCSYLRSVRWYPAVTNEYVGITFRAGNEVYTNVTRKVGEAYGELPVVYSNGTVNTGWYTTNGVQVAAESVIPAVSGDYRIQLIAKWPTPSTPEPTVENKVEPTSVSIVNGKLVIAAPNDSRFAYRLWYVDELVMPLDWKLYPMTNQSAEATQQFEIPIEAQVTNRFFTIETIAKPGGK